MDFVPNPASVARLVELGFSSTEAETALGVSQGDVEGAIRMLADIGYGK